MVVTHTTYIYPTTVTQTELSYTKPSGMNDTDITSWTNLDNSKTQADTSSIQRYSETATQLPLTRAGPSQILHLSFDPIQLPENAENISIKLVVDSHRYGGNVPFYLLYGDVSSTEKTLSSLDIQYTTMGVYNGRNSSGQNTGSSMGDVTVPETINSLPLIHEDLNVYENPLHQSEISIGSFNTWDSSNAPTYHAYIACYRPKTSSLSNHYWGVAGVYIGHVRLEVTYELNHFGQSFTINEVGYEGRTVELTLRLDNSETVGDITQEIEVSIPDECSYVTASQIDVLEDGQILTELYPASDIISAESDSLTWSTSSWQYYSTNIQSKTLKLKYHLDSAGTVTVTYTDNTDYDYAPSDVGGSLTFIIKEHADTTATYTDTCTDISGINITCEDSSTQNYDAHPMVGETVLIPITLDTCIYEKLSMITCIGETTHVDPIPVLFKTDFVDKQAVLPITAISSGIEHLQITYDTITDGVTTNHLGPHITLNIMPSDITAPFFAYYEPTEEEKNRMADGIVYTAGAYLKLTTEDTELRDWVHNFKIGVFNPASLPAGEDLLINDLLVDNVESWSPNLPVVNDWAFVTCEFPYHEETPILIIITGDFPETETSDVFQYITPVIIESDVYRGYEKTGNYPYPINNTLGDVDVASVTIGTFQSDTPIVFSEWDLETLIGANYGTAVTGIELEFTTNFTEEVAIHARLKSPTGLTGSRSIIIENTNETDTTHTIGGVRDTWGISVKDLNNLEDYEIEFQISNLYPTDDGDSTTTFKDVKLKLYTSIVDDAPVHVFIDGADTRFFDLFLRNIELPEGLETDTKYLEIDGTDSHDSYRQNIDRKEIKLTFDVINCDINTTSEILRTVTSLFQNKRDRLNRPILKTLELSNYPDIFWEYVMVEAFETDIDVANATIEIKLIIPSGTAYTKEDSITNTTGSVSGLAKVNPIITVVPTGETIEIYEIRTGQKFNLSYTNWTTNHLVEIDCINRIVLLKTEPGDTAPINITSYVDMNVDWFVLHGDYEFTSTNAMIQTVVTNERW